MKDNGGMNEKVGRSSCPINLALELFGDRWTLLIIRDMMLRQLSSYGDFLNSPEGISTNILANRLKQLEGCGLIEKYSDPRDRKKFIYLLTEKGEDLLPVLMEMVRWGLKHSDEAVIPEEFLEKIRSDLPGFTDEILDKLRRERQRIKQSLALV